MKTSVVVQNGQNELKNHPASLRCERECLAQGRIPHVLDTSANMRNPLELAGHTGVQCEQPACACLLST